MPTIAALLTSIPLGITAADLIPGLHRRVTPAASLRQFTLLIVGIGTIALFYLGHYKHHSTGCIL